MGMYSSWINVSQFMVTVEADNEEEAKKLIKDQLDNIEVVLFENGTEQISLGCNITSVDVL